MSWTIKYWPFEIEESRELDDQILAVVEYQENRPTPIDLGSLATDSTFLHSLNERGFEIRILADDLTEIIALASEFLASQPIDKGGRTPINDVRLLVRLVADFWRKSLRRGFSRSNCQTGGWDDFCNFVGDIFELVRPDVNERKIETALSEYYAKFIRSARPIHPSS